MNDEGTYVRGLVSFSYSTCSSKNTVTGSIQYKKSSATSWTSAGVAFSSGTAVIFGGGAISTETSYDIKYTLTDAFTSVSIQDLTLIHILDCFVMRSYWIKGNYQCFISRKKWY